MQWFSRWLRRRAVPTALITVVADSASILRGDDTASVWAAAFEALDSRSIAATWAVASGSQQLRLGKQLVASQVDHEIAFDDLGGHLAQLVPSLRQQAELARRVNLPIRTLVSRTAGAHPAVLAQLGVEAVVPTASATPSRTGTLRAVSWNLWEAPITDRADSSEGQWQAAHLAQRLDASIRESTRWHLLWRLGGTRTDDLAPLWDHLADYQSRGWISVETAGAAAAATTLATTGMAA